MNLSSARVAEISFVDILSSAVWSAYCIAWCNSSLELHRRRTEVNPTFSGHRSRWFVHRLVMQRKLTDSSRTRGVSFSALAGLRFAVLPSLGKLSQHRRPDSCDVDLVANGRPHQVGFFG